MADLSTADILDFARGQTTLTLSTCDEEGWAHATDLFFVVTDDLAFHWFSSPMSAHSRHVLRDARAAAAIRRPALHWQEICGLQMRGHVSHARDLDTRKAITEQYRARFQLGTAFDAALERSTLFSFVPNWVRQLDNQRGFGFKVERTFFKD